MNSNYYSKSKHESWLLCCFVMAFWRPWCAVMVYLIHSLEIGACTDVGQAARSDTAARVWKTLFNALHWCFMILVQSCAILYKSCMHACIHSFTIHSFIPSFIHSFIHSFIPWLFHFIAIPRQIDCAALIWYDWYLKRYRTSKLYISIGGFSSVVCAALVYSGRCHRGGGGAVQVLLFCPDAAWQTSRNISVKASHPQSQSVSNVFHAKTWKPAAWKLSQLSQRNSWGLGDSDQYSTTRQGSLGGRALWTSLWDSTSH